MNAPATVLRNVMQSREVSLMHAQHSASATIMQPALSHIQPVVRDIIKMSISEIQAYLASIAAPISNTQQ